MRIKCAICNKSIPAERTKFLKETGVDPRDMRCIAHALNRRIKGIYSGETGTSPIILCDHVYNDSVRQKFYEAENEIEENDNDE